MSEEYTLHKDAIDLIRSLTDDKEWFKKNRVLVERLKSYGFVVIHP